MRRVLMWNITTAEHGEIPVETRDKIDWVDERSGQTIRVGASAEIAYSYFFSRKDAVKEVAVKEISVGFDDWCEPRETTHRSAIAALCEANEWGLVSATETGQKD